MRWEIRSSTGSGSLDMMTASVSTESHEFSVGVETGLRMAAIGLKLPSTGIGYALLGVQLRPGTRNILARATSFEGAVQSNDFLDLALYLNPTVAGVFTYADVPGTPLQSATGILTNLVTGGTRISPGSFNSLNMNNKCFVESDLARLGSKTDGTLDALVLVGTPVFASTALNVMAELNIGYYN